MSEEFTAYDPATRMILYSGITEDASLLIHDAFVGVRADPLTERVRADLQGIEPKTDLDATFSATTITAGGSVTITVPEAAYLKIDGLLSGEVSDSEVVEFADAGDYALELTAISGLLLTQTQTITVTP